jgi:hypothetical protein
MLLAGARVNAVLTITLVCDGDDGDHETALAIRKILR